MLDEAFDEQVPLFERLKFCEIFDSNLNEWFMIRVGGLSDLATLKNQPKDNKSNETPAEQLDSIFAALPPLVERHESAVALVEDKLAKKGLVRVEPADYTDEDLAAVKRLFDERLSPTCAAAGSSSPARSRARPIPAFWASSRCRRPSTAWSSSPPRASPTDTPSLRT